MLTWPDKMNIRFSNSQLKDVHMAGQNAMHLAAQHSQDCLAVLLFGPLRFFSSCCCRCGSGSCYCRADAFQNQWDILGYAVLGAPQLSTAKTVSQFFSLLLGNPSFLPPVFTQFPNSRTVLAVLCCTPCSPAQPSLSWSSSLWSSQVDVVVLVLLFLCLCCWPMPLLFKLLFFHLLYLLMMISWVEFCCLNN